MVGLWPHREHCVAVGSVTVKDLDVTAEFEPLLSVPMPRSLVRAGNELY